jgi:RNA polymerase sigma-70 factor, ECF subfamily
MPRGIKFVEIYRPVICRLAGIRGILEADTEDLPQQVLMAVASAGIQRWEIDSQRSTFHTWLKHVANNAILKPLMRGAPE